MSVLPSISRLIDRGVVIPAPASVEIADDVPPEAVAPGVVIHAGSRLLGNRTWIGAGSIIGGETPATVENCQLGNSVELKGGYFSGATFLDRASMGSGAHIRPGTLIEEEASGAHCVGLKQTIFLSYVTAGSLINFCDALMAGGTSRKNHSEIGSSYIHFNFTPHQDKATASLIGDVPNGVFLDQAPIFLGGQGGLVGPCRLAFGSIIPAGTIFRRDAEEPGQLLFEKALPSKAIGRAYDAHTYGPISRIVRNNLIYIGNILALRAWYRDVRSVFMQRDPALHAGALARLDEILKERLKRLGELAEKAGASADILARNGDAPSVSEQRAFSKAWNSVRDSLGRQVVPTAPRELMEGLDTSKPYLDAVRGVTPAARKAGGAWLSGVVSACAGLWAPKTVLED